ncbi:hypothetical protein OG21DRAFT_1487585 [Imleria badia]|nr:hypothetical protein OG21DRAFT_1487585 [Imleria badia]
MHHALQIQEILLNIFGYSRDPSITSTNLPALARTCRAFKEPALDVLWKELHNPSPLAQCLPEASHYSQTTPHGKRYSFSKPLTQIEWGILRSYTRRIRSLYNYGDGLNWESVSTFLNPPTTEPLFPNLRSLSAARLTEVKIKHLLHMPFPSLISLDLFAIKPKDLHSLQGSLESFFKFSPNISKLRILLSQPDMMFSKFFSTYICRWRNLRTVDCSNIALDVDAFSHLSRMPAFTRFHCPPNATLPPADSPLFFSNLHHLNLRSEFLDPISQLLSRIRVPAITDVTAYVEKCPSKHAFSSLASIQTSAIGHTLQNLRFDEGLGIIMQDRRDVMYVLGFEDLQPCKVFSNLRRIYLDLGWDVNLSDGEMLTLVSTWPHLEHLFINEECGWNTPGGITPNGLLRLLQTCPSLSEIGLAIDTRSYTEFRESPASLGLTLPSTFTIDVLDSFIEEESIPAIAAFLAGIAPRSDFSFRAYKCWRFTTNRKDHEARWYDAYRRANVLLSERC